MISREQVENNQIWLYVVMIGIAAGIGLTWPAFSTTLDWTISFILAILLYGMFTQIPFLRLKEALSNQRFTYALLTVNYLIIPALVWTLTSFLPDHPSLLLGIYLVLLTPCIDYVIVFTHLGKGDEKLILVSTPILFITQMVFLPIYLWIFMGEQAAKIVSIQPFLEAFFGLIVLPLALALVTQLWAKQKPIGEKFLAATAWLPVPFMAITLFVVIVSQIGRLYDSFALISQVIPVYMAFMVIVPLLARLIVRMFRLDPESGRALIFSAGTRNSLVVLPFALALPDPVNRLVSAVIVTQTLVELVGELLYVRLIPRVILRDAVMVDKQK